MDVAYDASFEVKFYLFDRFIWFRFQFHPLLVSLIIQLSVMACYMLVAIILFMNTIVCDSCNSFYLNKWTGAGPVFRDIPAPGNASKSLSTCARWCIENLSCMMLSWSPGLCWQVGYCGIQIETGLVYDLKKDCVGWYLHFIFWRTHFIWVC